MNKYKYIRFLNLTIIIMITIFIMLNMLFSFSSYLEIEAEKSLGIDTRFVVSYITNQVRKHDNSTITNSIEVASLNGESAIYFRDINNGVKETTIIYKYEDGLYEVKFTGNEESKAGTLIGNAVLFEPSMTDDGLHIEYQATSESPLQVENIYLRGGEVYE